MILHELKKLNLIEPPLWLPNSIQLMVDYGSHSHGTAREDSDYDYFGFVIPPVEVILCNNFKSWRHFKIKYQKKQLDFSLYNITEFLNSCQNINPQFIGILFVNKEYHLICTSIGQLIINNRHLFLSKKMIQNFLIRADWEINTILADRAEYESKNLLSQDYDTPITEYRETKHVYHLIRLLNEAHQIVVNNTINIQEASHLVSSVKSGEWTINKLKIWIDKKKEKILLDIKKSNLPDIIYDKEIIDLLRECYKLYFGSSNLTFYKNDRFLAKWF